MSNVVRSLKKPFVTVGLTQADYVTDGTADDVQIQAAVDAVNAAGGGIVFLKAATYNIATNVLMKSNVTLQGAGMNATILTGNTTDYNLVKTTKSGTTKTVYANIAIKDVTFKSNYGSCLVINNTNGFTLEGCEFTFTVTTPIRQTLFTQHCQNVFIKNNNAHDYTGNGLSVTATDYFVIQGNTITGGVNGDDGIDVDYDFLDTSAIPSNYGTVVGNTVRTIGRGNGIRVENSNYMTVGMNTVDGVTTASGITAGILVNTSTTNVGTGNTVVGNIVSNCTSSGIAIDGTNLTNNIVSNNVIYNCGANSGTNPRGGIVLAAAGTVCTGNLVDTTAKTGDDGAGILLYKKNGQQVTDNKIRNCANAIQAWDGDDAQSYTGIRIVGNDVSDTNTNKLIVAAVSSGTIRDNQGFTAVPASASAVGTVGDIVSDANYIYVCTAFDTWKRVAISTW